MLLRKLNQIGGEFLKNKYENINMIELDAPEDIVDIFIECALNADKHKNAIGLIANRHLVEYTMATALSFDCFNVLKVDLDFEDESEFIISINSDGNITVLPATDYKLFEQIDYVYISYDGDVGQDVIDWFVDHDRDVSLFGLYDEPVCKRDKSVGQKRSSRVAEYDTDDGYHVTVKCDLDANAALKIIEDMEKRIARINDTFSEMDRFRQLFHW